MAAIELVLIRAAEEGILRSAHDVSGGGLAVALAESRRWPAASARSVRARARAGATTRCCSARAAGGSW